MTRTDTATTSRVDLHCRSAASALAKLGVQGSLGLPECATPPEEVHALAKRRGMDFVTTTDHDTSDGVLTIADRPEVFVSEELTVAFRGEPQQVHVLCPGITPDDHAERSGDEASGRGRIDIGRTYSETPYAATPAAFLAHVRAGAVRARGDQGSAARWAHNAMALAVRALGRDAGGAPLDPAALAGAVAGLARSPAMRERLARRGLAAVAERTWEAALGRLAAGWWRALAEHGAAERRAA